MSKGMVLPNGIVLKRVGCYGPELPYCSVTTPKGVKLSTLSSAMGAPALRAYRIDVVLLPRRENLVLPRPLHGTFELTGRSRVLTRYWDGTFKGPSVTRALEPFIGQDDGRGQFGYLDESKLPQLITALRPFLVYLGNISQD